MYRKLKSEYLEMTVSQFVKNVLPNQEADPAFQANKFTRWDSTQASNYMNATIRGQAISKYIFADVEKCLQSAIEEERPEDVEYFQYWSKKGVKFLNLDSNNRCINTKDFIDDKVTMLHGDYYFDSVFSEIGKLNNVYSKLPKSIKEAFDESLVAVHIFKNATREELSDTFININEGKPLNHPEKRNASTGKIANDIRAFSENFLNLFNHKNNKWFDSTQVNRRHIDDFIACMFHYFCFGTTSPISPLTLKQLYTIGTTEEKHKLPVFKKRFKQFMKWFDNGHINVLVNRNSVFDLWIIFLSQKQDEKKELRHDKLKSFMQHYATTVGNLLGDKTLYDRPPIKDAASFETMIGGKQVGNLIKRNELIMNKLDVDTYFMSKDSKRVITDTEKMVVAARDDFKTHEGKDIEIKNFNDGKTYHKGHVDSYAITGKTTVEKTKIQEAKDNLQTGQKSLTDNSN
jgi:hypothetical protein